MSTDANTSLIERAIEVQAYFEGTDPETAIANNLDRGDLDMVRHLVVSAEAEMSRQEFEANDVY